MEKSMENGHNNRCQKCQRGKSLLTPVVSVSLFVNNNQLIVVVILLCLQVKSADFVELRNVNYVRLKRIFLQDFIGPVIFFCFRILSVTSIILCWVARKKKNIMRIILILIEITCFVLLDGLTTCHKGFNTDLCCIF